MPIIQVGWVKRDEVLSITLAGPCRYLIFGGKFHMRFWLVSGANLASSLRLLASYCTLRIIYCQPFL